MVLLSDIGFTKVLFGFCFRILVLHRFSLVLDLLSSQACSMLSFLFFLFFSFFCFCCFPYVLIVVCSQIMVLLRFYSGFALGYWFYAGVLWF